MAKFKWGGSDLQEALEDESNDQNYEPYDGPRPRGVFTFKIKFMKAGTSTGGFPALKVGLEMHPVNVEHKKYKGYFTQQQIIVKEDGSTGFRVRPFLKALNLTAKQFLGGTVTDPDDDGDSNGFCKVTKLGPLKIEENKILVRGSVRPSKNNPDFDEVNFLPLKEAEAEDSTEADADDDGDQEEAPF